MNFIRSSHRLRISQSYLSKQINIIEALHRVHLFVRNKRRMVGLTGAGCAFVEEARIVLCHTERAIHLARTVDGGRTLMIGYFPRRRPVLGFGYPRVLA